MKKYLMLFAFILAIVSSSVVAYEYGDIENTYNEYQTVYPSNINEDMDDLDDTMDNENEDEDNNEDEDDNEDENENGFFNMIFGNE